MKRNILLIIAIMFMLPFIGVKIVPADAGMAFCFILFYAVNPVFSIVLGILSGGNLKRMWFNPIISSIIFLLSVWALFDIRETAFIIYSLAYLIICTISMLITYTIKR